MQEDSTLLKTTMYLTYPFIFIFGFYVIFNGDTSPGGGFQGGAILASVFIIQYFTDYDAEVASLTLLNRLEKLFYLCILLFAIFCIFVFRSSMTWTMKIYYMKLMNILIGLKVSCGLTVIFYRFVLFESR